MVCIYCGSDTKVANSRPQKRNNQVWRRRECLACEAVFTTEEAAQYGSAWQVKSADSRLQAFDRDKLFLSLYRCLQHRADPIADAAGLTETVLLKLRGHLVDSGITNLEIKRVVQVALTRFDEAAGVQYAALHKRFT
jgi:transcriptional repressor NrdR